LQIASGHCPENGQANELRRGAATRFNTARTSMRHAKSSGNERAAKHRVMPTQAPVQAAANAHAQGQKSARPDACRFLAFATYQQTGIRICKMPPRAGKTLRDHLAIRRVGFQASEHIGRARARWAIQAE